VDVRVLAATHVDLEAAVEKGTFREDLYYRLNVLQVVTAPLRERHGDIAMLANHFSRFYSQETGRHTQVVTVPVEHVAQRLTFGAVLVVFQCSHRRRNCLLTLQSQINGFYLPSFGQDQPTAHAIGQLTDVAWPGVLTHCDQRIVTETAGAAARVLGVSRPTFYRLLHKHQIR
jgi:transcriptional regulator of acetoin/glycerol metabolism